MASCGHSCARRPSAVRHQARPVFFVVDDQLTFFTSSLMMGPPAAWKCASRSRGECRASVRRALPFGRKPNRRTRHAIVGRLAGYPATAKAALRCCRQRRLASARRPAGLPARQRGEPRAWTTEDIGNSRHRRRNKPSIPPTRGLAKWFLGVPQPAVFLDLDMIAASWAVRPITADPCLASFPPERASSLTSSATALGPRVMAPHDGST